jgi:hypothetical protein
MPAPKLLLHPADPGTAAVPEDRLAQELQAIGLIAGRKSLENAVFYPVGEHFLQLVTFLGCSPAIELDPPDDPQELESASATGRFCHIFIDTGERLRFRGDSQTAGFSRTFLEIRGIYPAEAVPGPALLETLAALTGNSWTSIYLRE